MLAAVVAADPPSADVWNNYGLACREANQNEDAYQAYTKALSYDANNPRLLNDTAVILHYYLHRDYDKRRISTRRPWMQPTRPSSSRTSKPPPRPTSRTRARTPSTT